MDRITLTISSELFDDNTQQEASIRTNITVRQLIEEIRREFNLLEGEYSLHIKGQDKALEFDKTLEQTGVQIGVELVFERERRRLSQQIVARSSKPRAALQAITNAPQAFLRDEGTGKVYEILWQPAIIGRGGETQAGLSPTERVAVDLNDSPEARSVSRQHAQITEEGGQYYVEATSERNPTFLNEHELGFRQKTPVNSGNQVRVGKVVLTFRTR